MLTIKQVSLQLNPIGPGRIANESKLDRTIAQVMRMKVGLRGSTQKKSKLLRRFQIHCVSKMVVCSLVHGKLYLQSYAGEFWT